MHLPLELNKGSAALPFLVLIILPGWWQGLLLKQLIFF